MNSDRRPVNNESGCVSLPDSPTALGGRHWIDAFDGSRLAACRRARGLSQVELAERLQQARADTEVSVAEAARQIRTLVVQVSCYEAGRTRPRARAVQALAGVLDVDVLALLAADTPITLSTLRARHGLTQGDVAAQLGMSRSLYAAVEQGKRAIGEPELARLAAALRTTAEQVRQASPPTPA
jgi:transcriptional regulator with XRE-family HTH domain